MSTSITTFNDAELKYYELQTMRASSNDKNEELSGENDAFIINIIKNEKLNESVEIKPRTGLVEYKNKLYWMEKERHDNGTSITYDVPSTPAVMGPILIAGVLSLLVFGFSVLFFNLLFKLISIGLLKAIFTTGFFGFSHFLIKDERKVYESKLKKLTKRDYDSILYQINSYLESEMYVIEHTYSIKRGE